MTITRTQAHPWVAEGTRRIRFATAGGPFDQWPVAAEFVHHVEDLGFDAYWANDHPTRALDCWTFLSALAVSTRRIRLMSLVSCVGYRSPLVTARLAADVDRLSDGRLVLGLGIGDDTEEFGWMDLPMGSVRGRQQALAEAIEVITGLWSGQPFDYTGAHYRYSASRMAPGPVQEPHVPVLLAGGGERVTLRQVAQYADMANFGPHEWAGGAYDLGVVKRKLDVLKRHCDAVDRSYDTILRSHYSPLVVLAATQSAVAEREATFRTNPREYFVPFFATPPQAVAYFQALADAGMQYFLVNTQNGDLQTVELLAEHVVPHVHLP